MGPRVGIKGSYNRARTTLEERRRSSTKGEFATILRQQLYALRGEVEAAAKRDLNAAMTLGTTSAQNQLSYYGLTPPSGVSVSALSQYDAELSAVMLAFDAQAQRVISTWTRTYDLALLTGGDDRVGLLSRASLQNVVMSAVGSLLAASYVSATERDPGTQMKQAIAALDERTTDCCLQVHGQVVDWGGRFQLRGTPRLADEMEWAPFHYNCRTAITMYEQRYDDGITEQMQADAEMVRKLPPDERQRLFADLPANAFYPKAP